MSVVARDGNLLRRRCMAEGDGGQLFCSLQEVCSCLLKSYMRLDYPCSSIQDGKCQRAGSPMRTERDEPLSVKLVDHSYFTGR